MAEDRHGLRGIFSGGRLGGAVLPFPKRNGDYESEDLVLLPDVRSVGEVAAETIAAAADGAVEEHGRFVLAVSGGGPFDALWEALCSPVLAGRMPWDRTLVAFTDEPCNGGPGEAPHHRAFHDRLAGRVSLERANVFRMPVEQSNPTRAALFYDRTLREHLPDRDMPAFDLAILGIRPDGGTAGLFPGVQPPDGAEGWAAAVYVPHCGAWWLTLTSPALASSRRMIFLASGGDTAHAPAGAFAGASWEGDPLWRKVAAADGTRLVLADKEAGARIT